MAEKPELVEKRDLEFDGKELKQIANLGSNLIRTYDNYLIVDDHFYNEIKEFEPENYYGFQIQNWKATIESGESLLKEMGVNKTNGYGENFYFSSLGHDWNEMNQVFGAALFIGLFIGAVFFIAAGSFLYFRLYADLEDEKQKFSAISKIGLSNKELSKIITTQLALLFFVPIIVAVIHGAVALTALQHMFNYNLFKSSALVLGSFSLIQIIYFLIIRHNYIRKIKSYL